MIYQSGSSNGANAVDQMVSFAYEVDSHQVSKTPPIGEVGGSEGEREEEGLRRPRRRVTKKKW